MIAFFLRQIRNRTNLFGKKIASNIGVQILVKKTDRIRSSNERRQQNMDRQEYLEFIRRQPYDAMGDYSFLLAEKAEKAENTMVTAKNENMNAD